MATTTSLVSDVISSLEATLTPDGGCSRPTPIASAAILLSLSFIQTKNKYKKVIGLGFLEDNSMLFIIQ